MYTATMTKNQHRHVLAVLTDFSKMYHPNFDFLLKETKGLHDHHDRAIMIHQILKSNHVLTLYSREDMAILLAKFTDPDNQEPPLAGVNEDVVDFFVVFMTKEELALLSRLAEVHARLGLNQFDMLMGSYDRDDNDILSDCLEGHTGVPEEALNISWDIYQVARYRLSWDAAGNPPKRDFSNMMGVNYDDPLKRGDEPLMAISSN